MNTKAIYLFFLSFFVFIPSFSQILDDSTKQVYGFKSTKYFLEEDILNNHKSLYSVDTSINTFHLWNVNLRSNWQYQDLGNLGTAMKPIYFTPVEQIGTVMGFSAFTPYAFDVRKVHYYDSKSPYTNIYYVQAGNGQNVLRFTHSRNISKRWNVGIDVNRMTAAQQLGSPASSDAKLVDSWAFMLFSSYESKNKRYLILGNYNHFNHRVLDQGGIRPQNSNYNYADSLYNYSDQLVRLTGARSNERWQDFHIYQQYELTKGFHIFAISDYHHILDTYNDTYLYPSSTSTPSDSAFYPKSNLLKYDSTASQNIDYWLVENKIGIKGFYKGFNYRLHFRQRTYNYQADWEYQSLYAHSNSSITASKSTGTQSEIFFGAWAAYYFPDSLRKATAEMEINPLKGTLSLRGEYFSEGLKVGFYQTISAPNLLQNNFYGKILAWNNNFENVKNTNFYGSFDYQMGKFKLRPSASYNLLYNYIYFDSNALPTQISSTIHLLHLGFGAEARLKRWSFLEQLDYATSTETSIIRLPKIASNTRIAYEFIYSKVLHINTGVEVYYKSAYQADTYMPLTQQFYLSNQKYTSGEFATVWGKPVVDVFADFKIRRVRVFLKFSNISQLLGAPAGYYTSPYYTGLKSGFGLGVNWPLFD